MISGDAEEDAGTSTASGDDCIHVERRVSDEIEASPLRHLVVDLSCVLQDFDLRIMLITKRIMESFTAEEKHSIKEVIESAIIDPNVKGGLRWSLGKDSAGGRFYVQESFHILSRSFAGPTVRLKLRNADRFKRSSSHGKISDEVSVKLIGVRKHLKELVALSMAYIPPHMRKVKEGEKELHPEVLAPKFDEQLRLGSRHAGSKGWKTNVLPFTIQYAENSIVRCFPVGSMENGELPDSICLEPFLRPDSLDYGHRTGRKYFVLHNVDEPKDSETSTCRVNKEEWLSIAEKIQSDVVTAFQNVRNLIQDDEHIKLKPSFVARIRKILFHRQVLFIDQSKESINLAKIKRGFLTEINPECGVSKMFNTDVTEEYMNFVENKVVQDIGLTLMAQKDEYHLKIEDKQLPDCVLTCRCVKNADGKLELKKIEASPLRHLVVDLSCVFQDFDLRIMLIAKRILESFTAEEKHSIKEVIESSILDPNVKGGLRWSLGKDSAGGRFYVQESFHILSRSFAGPTVRLKLRSADRFNLRSSHGKISEEVSVKLIGVSEHLKEADGGDEALQECLQDTLKLIWDNFINYKR
ncbi:hypothetical protein EJ110_NYTH20618 [Nymphaea thermarum]|nr:hypothetical protein EJ110_NYTH20618 [Nymphaea thermarum]